MIILGETKAITIHPAHLLSELSKHGYKEEITTATLSKKLRTYANMLNDKFEIQIELIRKSVKRIQYVTGMTIRIVI